MLISDFDYDLPAELIAQEPLAAREASRMLVVDRANGTFSDHGFVDLPNYLSRGDVLVLNDTRVFPARLIGQTSTGANVEVFLVREITPGIWETLAKPARRLHQGKTIAFGERLTADVVERRDDGKVVVRFESNGDFYEILDEIGKHPYLLTSNGQRQP
jgi:S-adenosylmethionine:tRNA ribosyltransferase-isomerase